MKKRRAAKPPDKIPFLNVVRFLFIVVTTTLTYLWVGVIIPYVYPGDEWVYATFALSLAIILVFIESQIRRDFPHELIIGLFGLICGLSTSALLQMAIPENLPQTEESITRIALHFIFGYLGVTVALRNAHRLDFTGAAFIAQSEDRLYGSKILDTSVLIDGRIIEIIDSRFIEGMLIIPSFVINELQVLSDSSDHIKRSKGRRGLDISKRLQNNIHLEIEILEDDFPNLKDVDQKLLALSKKYQCTLVTIDFNLSKVAEIEDIPVLNINRLAQSLKTVVLPGEELNLQITREGKETNQGVGYLEDGTMVVMENGKQYLGQTVQVKVASVLQTSAGRMIFSKLKEPEINENEQS